MDHKPWRWRRKASEKTILANGRASLSLERSFEEDQENEAGSLKCSSNLSDRLPSVICDCSAKDELIRKHRRIAEQALAGQEMERAEAAYLREELEKALQQGEVAEKKLANLNAALKDCMQEMEALRGQQDERIQNIVSKAKLDCEKERAKLEAKLAEANKRMSNLSAENANLMKALICKERLLHDLDKGKAELESELGILTGRLESAEKENSFLKYEFRVMEKELQQLRNEERNYGRRSALEHSKQINQLEAECQQLRHLVRKRLQVDVQGTDQVKKKRLNPMVNNPSEKHAKGTSYLIDRVHTLEEENTTLREILKLSDSELESWRIKYGQMGSRLAELKAQLQELSRGENSMQLAVSGFGLGSYDGVGDSELWASALLAELEQFRQGKIEDQQEFKAIVVGGKHNYNVEMEKFAIVSTEKAVQGSGNEFQLTKTELLPVPAAVQDPFRHHCSWLDEILNVILEEHRVSKRNLGELLQDIKIALGQNDSDCSKPKEENCSEIRGLLTWEESAEPTHTQSNHSISMEEKKVLDIKDASFAREKIRKHVGFDRSKSDMGLELHSPNRHNTLSQMIAIQSTMQDESRRIKEKLQRVTEEKVAQRTELQESKKEIASLQHEVESLKESKGLTEDQIENQRLINEDLNTQLTVAKAKLNEFLHKLSSLEVELDHRNNCCEELEGTCLELQLQLETVSRKESPNTFIDAVAKQLFDQALRPVTASEAQTAQNSDKKSLNVQHSLRDCLMEKESGEPDSQKFLRSDVKANDGGPEKSIVAHTDYRTLPAPESKAVSPAQVGTLAVVPSKAAGGGFGFIRKLFWRRKRGCTKMKAVSLQRNTSALIKQRDVLLIV